MDGRTLSLKMSAISAEYHKYMDAIRHWSRARAAEAVWMEREWTRDFFDCARRELLDNTTTVEQFLDAIRSRVNGTIEKLESATELSIQTQVVNSFTYDLSQRVLELHHGEDEDDARVTERTERLAAIKAVIGAFGIPFRGDGVLSPFDSDYREGELSDHEDDVVPSPKRMRTE